MALTTAFDRLSAVVEEFESSATTVRRVDARTSEGDGSPQVHATIDLPVSLCGASSRGEQSALSPESATLTEDGGLTVEFGPEALPDLPSSVESAVTRTRESVRVTDDEVLATLEFTIDAAASPAVCGAPGSSAADVAEGDAGRDDAPVHDVTLADDVEQTGGVERTHDPGAADDVESVEDAEPTDDLASVRDDDLPPYEDVAYLEQLYESCDTFVEMAHEIEMDVASETVRRYMVDAGVHDPESYDTDEGTESYDTDESTESYDTDEATDAETGDAETPEPADSPTATDDPRDAIPDRQVVTDGIGLPDHLRIADVADAVVESATVYQAQQQLGLEREHTRELLEQLNLLDLVSCRIAKSPERTVSYEEVASRVRECGSGGAETAR